MIDDVKESINDFYTQLDDFIYKCKLFMDEYDTKTSSENKNVNKLIEEMKSMIVRGTSSE